MPIVSECSDETDLWMQKRLDPLLFKIACAQAAKNKWVEMGKRLVPRKVRFFQDIDIQDDAIGNMLVKFPSLVTCSPYKKIWLLIIASQYYEGPISPCTLVSVLLTASGTLTPCSCRNNILPVISPSTTKELPEGYVERVKHVHDSGGYGSRGYEYDWSKEEANKNLLRNHKTAVSARMLYELAKV
ncbi:phenylalanine--tRNA ligase alpha subunit, cytoplasmic-like [Quercus robur]|uniref:phenylalanine--tRNA ligase alpha subunit, cytoplasmic-like n=1 Tax=Quercus robur TaxID=38942 RepID=UPI0021634A25|nr:phenylalanine--tRNA ligase alpha subunit, cytoplasmic-like [Quercus robur]